MKDAASIFLLLFAITFFSCSTIRLTNRNEKDIHLHAGNFENLKGNYSNLTTDTIHLSRTLFNNFQFDTLYRQKHYSVDIVPIDHKKLSFKLYNKDSLIQSLNVKGKFKRGYFKVKRGYKTKFIAGPLLWVFGENLKYIGLTKNNNLVVINLGSSGFLMLIVIPIFAAGGGQFVNEYTRMK